MKKKFEQLIPPGVTASYSGNMAICEFPSAEAVGMLSVLHNEKKLPLMTITATDERAENDCFKIWYLFGIPHEHALLLVFVVVKGAEQFPSLCSSVYASRNYERRIRSFFGLIPAGHSDNRPLILHENWPTTLFPLRKDFAWDKRPEAAKGEYAFQKVEGEGVCEIPVGPIHAGIIEPGHFRFSVVGEQIVNLEPRLGYTHKGSEKLFEMLPMEKKVVLAEKISGDSSFSHALAFCQAVEQLGRVEIPTRALYLRVIYAELERIANHIGDIGAIMMDTGFNFGGAQGSRLREMVLRMNEQLTGSRFLRGVVCVGGVTKDVTSASSKKLLQDIESLEMDFSEAIDIAESSTSLLNRLRGTGTLSPDIVERGILGVAGRALGVEKDARRDFPYAAYAQLSAISMASEKSISNDSISWSSFLLEAEVTSLVTPPTHTTPRKNLLTVSCS